MIKEKISVKKLILQSGFKNEMEFSEFLKLHIGTIKRWIKNDSCPIYVLRILEIYEKNKISKEKFEYLMNENMFLTIEEKILKRRFIKLNIENDKLRKKIESLKAKILT